MCGTGVSARYLRVEEAGLDEGGGVGVLVLLSHQVQLQQCLWRGEARYPQETMTPSLPRLLP